MFFDGWGAACAPSIGRPTTVANVQCVQAIKQKQEQDEKVKQM